MSFQLNIFSQLVVKVWSFSFLKSNHDDNHLEDIYVHSHHGYDVIKSQLHIDLNRLVHIRRRRDVVVQVRVVVHKKLKFIRTLLRWSKHITFQDVPQIGDSQKMFPSPQSQPRSALIQICYHFLVSVSILPWPRFSRENILANFITVLSDILIILD